MKFKVSITTLLIVFLALGCQTDVIEQKERENEFLIQKIVHFKKELNSTKQENELLKQRIVRLQSELELKEELTLKKMMKIDWDKILDELKKMDIKEKENRVLDMRQNRKGRENSIDMRLTKRFKSLVSPSNKVKDVDAFFKNHQLNDEYLHEVFLKRLLDIKAKLIKQGS